MPSILYRYCPLRDVDADDKYIKPVFVEHELYFPSRLQLNDPFECIVPNFLDVPKSRLKPFIERHAAPSLRGMNRNARQLTLKHLMKKESLEKARADIQSKVDQIGILSMTEMCDDLLMWAHYANSHHGLCLGFRISDTDPFFGRALKVEYSADRSEFDPVDDELRFSRKVILTKSEHWCYEKEWRAIDLKGRGSYTYPSSTLTRVIFGCRTSDDDVDKVKNWLKEGKLNPSLFRAVEDSREFQIVVKDLL
jgi:hypothetical protein